MSNQRSENLPDFFTAKSQIPVGPFIRSEIQVYICSKFRVDILCQLNSIFGRADFVRVRKPNRPVPAPLHG